MADDIKPTASVEVLAERVKGLTDLTQSEMRGIKETLGRIEQNSQGYATKIELEEAKKDFNRIIDGISKELAAHNLADKESFGGLKTGQEEMVKKQDKLALKIAFWGGGIAVVVVVANLAAPYIIKKFFGG